jgi:hypothetical protein
MKTNSLKLRHIRSMKRMKGGLPDPSPDCPIDELIHTFIYSYVFVFAFVS